MIQRNFIAPESPTHLFFSKYVMFSISLISIESVLFELFVSFREYNNNNNNNNERSLIRI